MYRTPNHTHLSIPDHHHKRPNTNFDFIPWLSKHGNDETRPNVDKVIAALREQGVTEFGVTGYCFGGMSLSLDCLTV